MEEMEKTFVPRLNDFTEKLKEIQKVHEQHIKDLNEEQKLLQESIKDLKKDLKIESKRLELNNIKSNEYPEYTKLESKLYGFEKQISIYRSIYKEYINDTNLLLGRFSNHWGGYIEQVGVEYIMNTLRNECKAFTFYQKFKRYWHASKNMDLDFVGVSKTHVYIVEVKNQLRADVIDQILSTHLNIEKHVPEFENLIKQAVVLCVHADEELLKTLNYANVWVLKYNGFDNVNQICKWIWIHGSTTQLSAPKAVKPVKATKIGKFKKPTKKAPKKA